MRSVALVRFERGSQDASWSGYPTHLTRYSRALRRRRESRMRSTSYSSWSSMVMAGGGGEPVEMRSVMVAGAVYARSRFTWKTRWMLRDAGSSSLYVMGEI